MIDTPKFNPEDERWVYMRTAHGTYLGMLVGQPAAQTYKLAHPFECLTQVGQTPDGRIARNIICLPFDSCQYDVVITIHTSSCVLVHLKDMDPKDIETYRKLVIGAHKLAVASRSNLVVPGVQG